jgi:hypothetical protein
MPPPRLTGLGEVVVQRDRAGGQANGIPHEAIMTSPMPPPHELCDAEREKLSVI